MWRFTPQYITLRSSAISVVHNLLFLTRWGIKLNDNNPGLCQKTFLKNFLLNQAVPVVSSSFLARFPFILRKNTGGKEQDPVLNISVKIVKTCRSQISLYTWNTLNKSTPLMELNSFQSNGNDPARQALYSQHWFLSWQPLDITGSRRRQWLSVWSQDHRSEEWQSPEL